MGITSISAYEMRDKILNKEITVTQLIEAHLKRIREDEDARVEAFITVNEKGALEQAKRIDEKIENGEDLGVLAGLPIAIKDNISMKNLKMTCGSRMLEDYIPPFDASLIEYIKEEDGIIIGKTNLDEFAVGSSTEGSYYGVTSNPVDKSKVPGGSSGGSASAVGSDQAVLGVGTDTGGSVRQPAAFCDVVGIKPTYGTISRYGVVAMASSLDQAGVFGRDTKDAALLLSTLMKFDEKDSTSYEKSDDILKDFDLEKEYDLKGMKIGIPIEFKEQITDESVNNKLDNVIKLLEELGGEVEEISLPNIKFAPACYHVISTAEVSSSMARYDGIIYGHRADDYEDLDELYINSRSESLGDEVKRRIVFGNYVLSQEHRDKYYTKALKVRRLIKEDFDKAFKDYDLILSPTSPTLPFEIGKSADDTKLQYKSDLFTVAVNLAGIPAISLPAGRIDDLPFGIQLMAKEYGEDDLIRAGLAFEGGNVDEL